MSPQTMTNPHGVFQSPTWLTQAADEVEDVDEPPELHCQQRENQSFRRTSVRKTTEQPSLLTKAIMGHSDDETYEAQPGSLTDDRRRRSMASNVSIASTADLTSDTGLTSPARTNTPSPPPPEMTMLRINDDPAFKPRGVSFLTGAPARLQEECRAQEPPRKRCIQFACDAKPVVQERPVPMIKTPSANEVTRRPCIKFACPARPSSTQNTPPKTTRPPPVSSALRLSIRAQSPAARASNGLPPAPPSPRQSTPRKPAGKAGSRPRFLRASSVDLARDGSQFHEFARETAREDDWIRQESSSLHVKLTINDTLTKENHIRRLATEAEEEAEQEDEDEEAALDGENDLDEDEEDEEEDENDDYDDDEDEDEDEDDGGADGYSTDEETGFADSDEDEDEDENMILWTPVQNVTAQRTNEIPKLRRPSLHEQHSDSSTTSISGPSRGRRERLRHTIPPADTPDLPDSTDFVCGTLDEDRPLEEAYLSNLTARRNEKLRVIPQDIDPSFPASDPEDEEDQELYNPVHHSSDEETWMQGKMEDLHHDQGRSRRKKKSDGNSPRRYHSPPPKRHLSPVPKVRGRSPKPLFDRHSPRRARSPAPKGMTTPVASPRQGANEHFQLAGRPGLVFTKSLPRPGAMFAQMKHGRCPKNHHDSDGHLRGAIDIVKGLEKKRQRRREKFHLKYCDRARRGQIPERKPLPGRGAERMRELGLLMAGKKDQGNYVLSV